MNSVIPNSAAAAKRVPSPARINTGPPSSTQVAIHAGRKGGKVEFEFYSQSDLERLLEAWGVL